MTQLPPSSRKVQTALHDRGLELTVVELPSSTRTAQEAASSLGCAVSDILKSLVFLGQASMRPWLVLATGANRINEFRLGAATGEPMRMATAAEVRDLTGFAIGGVPPIGHATALPTLIDREVIQHAAVWAAAGTPRTVFQIQTADLIRITNGVIADLSGPDSSTG